VVVVLHKFIKYLVEHAVRYHRLLAFECHQYSYCSTCEIYAAECRLLLFVLVDLASESGYASFSCKPETFMALLLSAGVEINFLDHHDRTALHVAAREGHEDVVKLLVSSGAEVNLHDEDYYSPLHYACMEGHIAVATILLGSGANAQARADEDGFTPLHIAIKSSSSDLIQLLLAHDCGMKEKTNVGKTTLHPAEEEGNEVFVKLSLENGVEKDSADNYGIRPIHDAANAAVARMLLDAEVDVHSPDIFDETPLLSAAGRDDGEVVELLLEHKANVDA
jgi:ankyrin repeat protein